MLAYLLLALAFRAFGTKLPQKRQASLQVLGHSLRKHRVGLLASFALFATAPLPSAQMFEAAGLAHIRLRPLVAAFSAATGQLLAVCRRRVSGPRQP